jgi:hypothetical protein
MGAGPRPGRAVERDSYVVQTSWPTACKRTERFSCTMFTRCTPTRPARGHCIRAQRSEPLVLRIDRFAREAIERESAELGVSARELASFALLYYVADLNSGRIARRLPALTPPR